MGLSSRKAAVPHLAGACQRYKGSHPLKPWYMNLYFSGVSAASYSKLFVVEPNYGKFDFRGLPATLPFSKIRPVTARRSTLL